MTQGIRHDHQLTTTAGVPGGTVTSRTLHPRPGGGGELVAGGEAELAAGHFGGSGRDHAAGMPAAHPV
ncbi:hypothetical protein EF910_21940 [Streptomyces sp. WAC07149]|uniref:hypothetical protein n=1 Tax=Streptomyces sp. WAC07149 TaxID=2487425 RepID=UPI000F782FA2|nr:hypothetical protein [Streptomyces sp. WAC07149]RST02946.1 hypothetical protein EF910_21940 [Streptomyces sp. WAC07149]